MLSVDPALRQRRLWAKNNGVADKHGKTEKINDLDVLFRPSQVFLFVIISRLSCSN